MKHTFALAVALTIAAAAPAWADDLVVTATPGPTGQSGGYTLDSGQWLGVRFTTTAPKLVTKLEAHVQAFSGDFFYAIFPVDSGTNLPPAPPNVTTAKFIKNV